MPSPLISNTFCPLVTLSADFSETLVMEFGSEVFVNSDWFEVGVVWVLDVYGCIEFFCFGIFHVHEVVFM